MITVCELATKKVISIDEKTYDVAKHSKDLSKCKEIVQPKTIQVCELATKKLVTIDETKFDALLHSKNLDDCGQILTAVKTPAVLPKVLPSTGTHTGSFAFMTTVLSGLTYGATLLVRRNR